MVRDHDLFPDSDPVEQLLEPILRFAHANFHSYISIGSLPFVIQRRHPQEPCGPAQLFFNPQ